MNKIVCAMLLALSPFASAQEQKGSPFYLKLGYGRVDLDIHGQKESDTDRPNGYALTFGYQSSPYLALEGSYTHLGEKSGSYSYTNSYGEPGLDDRLVEREVSYDASQYWTTQSIGAVLSTNVYRAFFAGLRVGYHKWETETELSESGTYTEYELNNDTGLYELYIADDFSSQSSYETGGSDPYYGVTFGLSSGNWVLSADYTTYEMDDSSAALGALSIGVRF